MPRSFVLPILTAAVLAWASPAAGALPGQLDPTFSGDGIATTFTSGSIATAVAVDHAGRTVVVGYTVDEHVDVAAARFLPDGTLDPTFDADGRVRLSLGADATLAFDVAVAGDDGLAITGRWTGGGKEDSFVLRLDPNGEPVAAFGVDGLALVSFGVQEAADAISFTPQGRIDIGGYASNGSATRSALARLQSSGAPDNAFSGDGKELLDLSAGAEQVNDLVVLPGGDIVGGGYAEFGALPRFCLFRVHGNGALATGFGHAGKTRTDLGPGADIANAMTRTSTGAFVLVGSAANGGHRDWGVVRYTPDGKPDTTFGSSGIVILPFSAAPDRADAVVRSGAKLVIAGRIHRTSTGDDAGVVRLRSNGTLDPTFATGGVARIDVSGGVDAAHGVALQANGKIVAGGETWTGGFPRFLAFRLKGG